MQRFDLWGWILFLLCALLFGAAGLRDGDVLMTVGSVFFLVACVLFLVPYVRR
ncbi:MAG: cytochrome oxidase subunit III [Nitriliruptor sp.]|nr:MAG: cytochrome oxidase subunit III [Nitriliruptor sp.]